MGSPTQESFRESPWGSVVQYKYLLLLCDAGDVELR